MYSSENHGLNEVLLNGLYSQLPSHKILVGDFNAHNQFWGGEKQGAEVG